MTVPTTQSSEEFSGNGVTTTFSFNFPFFQKSDLVVTLIDSAGGETVWILGTDYTIPGVSWPNGGQVDATVAPATGETLVVSRELEATQDASFRNLGDFKAEVHEDAFDKVVMLIQQFLGVDGRYLKKNLAGTKWLTENLPFDSIKLGGKMDAAGNKVINLPKANNNSSPVTLGQLSDFAQDDPGAVQLRIDLAQDDGEALVGSPDTVADMKLLTWPAGTRPRPKGYYSTGDVAGLDYLSRGQGWPVVADGFVDHADADGNFLELQISDVLNVKQAGAVGGGVDDSAPINAATDTGRSVIFPKDVYALGAVDSPYTLDLTTDGQALYFDGSEVRFLGKGAISARANNVTIDLQGGTLTHYIGYAEVAADTVDGSNTIQVVDSSNLFVNQEVASSWGNNGGSGVFPLGGPTESPKRRIQQIVGNTVTLDTNMTSGDVLHQQVIFGDFSFTPIIFAYKDKLTIKGGTLDRVAGYYYFSPNAVGDPDLEPGGNIYFEDCHFGGNGTDQFLLKHNQKLHLINCTGIQQWDTAKTGVFFADGGSLYISDCRELGLGNYDSPITMTSTWDGSVSEGEIIISNSNIDSSTRFTSPPPASQGEDSLQFIAMEYEGTFDRISLQNTRVSGITRWVISSTTIAQAKSTALNSLRIDNCLLDGSAFNFLHTGSGNGINCPNVRISNTSYFQENGYIFQDVQGTSGAASFFEPHYDNCYFRFSGDAGGFIKINSRAFVSNSTFNLNGLTYEYSDGHAILKEVEFTGSPKLAISPSFEENFYGRFGDIIIDDPNFPTSPELIFTALGGSSLSGAILGRARKKGSNVYYDVYKDFSTVSVRSQFFGRGGAIRLTDSEYLISRGSTVTDYLNGQVRGVEFSHKTTLSSAASSGATSINVSSSTGVNSGDRISIVLDDGLVDTLTVAGGYAGGNPVPLTTGLTGDAAGGNLGNFFRISATA